MRILVIAAIRSGGFYFTKSLSDTYNLDHVHEPHPYKSFDDCSKRKKVCIKIVNTQLSRLFPTSDDGSMYDKLYADILGKNFDKIFLLSRRNKKEHIESIVNLHEVTREMHKEWNFDDTRFKTVDNEVWEWYGKYPDICSNQMNHLSKIFNIPIIYYEDLYYDTENVDLQGLEFKPDLSKKLRKTVKNKKLL